MTRDKLLAHVLRAIEGLGPAEQETIMSKGRERFVADLRETSVGAPFSDADLQWVFYKVHAL